MPLSVKSFEGGTAHYRTDRGAYSVDPKSWLVLNDQEPYTIEFDSQTLVRSTVIFFPEGWAERVARTQAESDLSLIDDPKSLGQPFEFTQTVAKDLGEMKPHLAAIDKACRGKRVCEGWLTEQLNELLAALVISQGEHSARAAKLPASKRSTRAELYRRLCRGRDFLHANAFLAPTLEQTSNVANLSPYHFQRSFKAAFGLSPRQYCERIRLDRARDLLASNDLPTLQIAVNVGYESYGAFHAAFLRRFGRPPSKVAN